MLVKPLISASTLWRLVTSQTDSNGSGLDGGKGGVVQPLARTQSRTESWKEAEFSLSWKEERRVYYNI